MSFFNSIAVLGKRFSRIGFFVVALVITLALTFYGQKTELNFQGPIMGTQYKLTLACETDLTPQVLLEIAVAEMDAVNSSMSTYLADSELSQFNHSDTSDWQAVSPDLLKVMEVAQAVSIQSEGAFDVTVSPLVDLWGFGSSKQNQLTIDVPNDEELQATKAALGYDKVELDSIKQQWRKTIPNLQVDLSAVAKGYAVDKVSDALVSAGCQDHLVDIGGELKLLGKKNEKGDLWRIAIEKPDLSTMSVNRIQKLLNVSGVGVASSGDYRNFHLIDGKRYSHTIDPRTTRPIEHSLASVTVLHEQTAVADAWATALMVLGDEAPALAEKRKLAAYFIFRELDLESGNLSNKDSRNAKKYRIVATKQFDKFLMNK